MNILITFCVGLALMNALVEAKCKKLKTNCSQKDFTAVVKPHEIPGENPISALKGCKGKALRMEYSGSNKFVLQPKKVDHFRAVKFCFETMHIGSIKFIYETVDIQPFGPAIVEKLFTMSDTTKWTKTCPELSLADNMQLIWLEALPAKGMEAEMMLRKVFLKAKLCVWERMAIADTTPRVP